MTLQGTRQRQQETTAIQAATITLSMLNILTKGHPGMLSIASYAAKDYLLNVNYKMEYITPRHHLPHLRAPSTAPLGAQPPPPSSQLH